MRDRALLAGSLTVVVAAAGFGLLGPLARFAYDRGLDPIAFVAWRAAFGALTVATFVAIGRSRGTQVLNPLQLPMRDGLALLVAGCCGLGLNLAMFVAFDLTAIALALLAFYTYPAMVAVVAIATGREAADRARIAALVLASAGTALVVVGSLGSGQGADATGAAAVTVNPVGIGWGLAAALCQTLFVTISRDRYRQVPTEQATLAILVVTSLACIVLSVAGGGAIALPLRDLPTIGITIVAGVAAAGIPSVLFLRGIRTIGGTRAGILMLFEPLVGVALAALLLEEALTPIQALGGVGILAGALLLQRAPRGADEGPPAERLEPAAVPASDRA
jgi:drug/metabolite transporter (DMT)-like permease